jgi:hypothetical protein
MIVVELKGGLGNQMFQYAFASILANKNKAKVVIEGVTFEKVEKTPGYTPRKFELAIFGNHYDWVSASELYSFNHLSILDKVKKKLGLNYPKIYNESSFGFQKSALLLKSPVYVKGYFQSYKYLLGYEDFIRQLFSFPIQALDEINIELLKKIRSSNTIAIHIRRGDYVNDKLTADYHGSCSIDYYLEAIKLLVAGTTNIALVFFSDDSDWVKEQFKDLPYSKIFVDHNKGTHSWKDMFLMSCCKHNIIANSSFSWWGAWLNINPEKKVIAPKNWYKTKDIDTQTLLPKEWIKK